MVPPQVVGWAFAPICLAIASFAGTVSTAEPLFAVEAAASQNSVRCSRPVFPYAFDTQT